jgi:hypothetical protein
VIAVKRRWRFWWFGLCLFGLFWIPPSDAAGIQIVTTLGYNGYIIPEHWVPLQIQLKGMNESSARIEIIREDRTGARFERIESFLLHGVNRAEFPVFAAENIKSITVRVLTGDQLLAEQALDMKSKVFPGHLVLTANIPAIETQSIEQSLLPIEPVMAVPVNIRDLPNMGLDYDGISCLVLNDPEPVFSPAQLKALRYWLAGGGKLVVFGMDQGTMNILSTLGVQRINPVKGLSGILKTDIPMVDIPITDIPLGLGNIRVIRNRFPENLPGGNIGFWRKWLALKPYHETARLTAGHCFFNEPWGQEDKKTTYPFSGIAIIFTIWTGVALGIIWRHPKNLLVSFLVFTLVSAGLMIPLAGHLTATWRRGALVHSRAVILPGSGGMLLESNIQLKPSQGASPWGMEIKLGREEQGRINFRGQQNTAWNHGTAYPWYTVYAGDITMLRLMGVFPDVSVVSGPIHTPLQERKQWFIPATSQTVLWDGKQWRVLKKSQNGGQRWVSQEEAPVWLKDDESWLRKLQTLWPGTAWLCGRSVLPAPLQLRIQTGPAPEVFWAMPDVKSVSKE